MIRLRHAVASLALCGLGFLGACGGESVVDPGNGNGGGPINLGPLALFDIGLRPQAIQRASSLAGTTPNPVGAAYFLTAFFQGGKTDATFDWSVPAALGSLQPNTDQLSVNSATVTVVNDGRTPLGFYDVSVSGTSAGVTSAVGRRFAVVETNWMKHRRTGISDPNKPPEDLVSFPIYAPRSDGTDQIFYVSWPNDDAVNIFGIEADRPLDASAQQPRNQIFRPPSSLDPNAASQAKDLAPDLSPDALGRNEILFSSEMDVHAAQRATTVQPTTPFSLWVVRRHDALNDFTARVLTYDSTFASTGGLLKFYSFNFLTPRWDRSPTGPVQDARIGFRANMDPSGLNVWLADLRDINMDARSDTLVNYRRLTDRGSVNSFDWHPNGQFIYYTSGLEKRSVIRIDVQSGAEEIINFTFQDSLIENVTSISVFDDGVTLLAFEALSENRLHLYVYNESDQELTRLNRFAFPISHRLFPRWHPTRREIVFVSDYSIAAWIPGVDPTPVGNPTFAGQRRTTLPSVWTVRLADRP